FLFDKGFEIQKATTRQLQERLSRAGASGQTVRRCVAFFVTAATDAGIPLSPYIKSPRNMRGARVKGDRSAITGQLPRVTEDNADSTSAEPTKRASWLELLLSKFPQFDPTWPDEVKSRWLEAFDHLAQMGPEVPRLRPSAFPTTASGRSKATEC